MLLVWVVLGMGLSGLGAGARLVVGTGAGMTVVVLALSGWWKGSGLLGGEEAWLTMSTVCTLRPGGPLPARATEAGETDHSMGGVHPREGWQVCSTGCTMPLASMARPFSWVEEVWVGGGRRGGCGFVHFGWFPAHLVG